MVDFGMASAMYTLTYYLITSCGNDVLSLCVCRLKSGCLEMLAVATVYQWITMNQSKYRMRLYGSVHHLLYKQKC